MGREKGGKVRGGMERKGREDREMGWRARLGIFVQGPPGS